MSRLITGGGYNVQVGDGIDEVYLRNVGNKVVIVLPDATEDGREINIKALDDMANSSDYTEEENEDVIYTTASTLSEDTEESEYKIEFLIRGDSSPFTAAHICNLYIDTNGETPTSFKLLPPWRTTPIEILEGSLPHNDTSEDIIIKLEETGTNYKLSLEKTPDDAPGGTWGSNSDWAISICGLSGTNTIDTSIYSQDANEGSETTNNVGIKIKESADIEKQDEKIRIFRRGDYCKLKVVSGVWQLMERLSQISTSGYTRITADGTVRKTTDGKIRITA